MILYHNLRAMNSHRNMGIKNNKSAKSMEKLSSGLRINRASDDAAGLSISEKMKGQIRGLNQATRNSQDGISLIQTAEGSMGEAHNVLQRMRELAVQGANDTNVDADRSAIASELESLVLEVDRIANTTEFNEQKLLNGMFASKKLQIGSNKDIDLTLSITIEPLDSMALGIDALSVDTHENAQKTISIVSTAIKTVSTERSKLGAIQNRLEHTISNLDNSAENLQAAESRIRDVDMAKEMMEFSKNNVLEQAAQSMLAQANQEPQDILKLMKQ